VREREALPGREEEAPPRPRLPPAGLSVRDAFEDLVDHAEVILVGPELLFQVDEVAGEGGEAVGEEAGNVDVEVGMAPQEGRTLLDQVAGGAAQGANGRGVGTVEEHGDFAEDGAGARDARKFDVVLRHADGTARQHEEFAGLLVLREEYLVVGERNPRQAGAAAPCLEILHHGAKKRPGSRVRKRKTGTGSPATKTQRHDSRPVGVPAIGFPSSSDGGKTL